MPNPSAETRLNFFRSDLGNSKTLNEKFNKIYTAHPGNWENISQMLTAKKGFSKALVNKLGFTHKVADWTNDNHKLVAAFQKDAGTNSLADIAGKYNRKAFVQLIKKEKAHALGETAKSVAGKLYDDLFHAEPTAMVKRMVSDNKEITGGKVNHRESTLKFLNLHAL